MDPDDLTAAELAFGLLDDADRRSAEQRRMRDARFDALCWQWREYAATWLDGRPIVPDPALWTLIVARLPGNGGEADDTLRRLVRRWRASTRILAALSVALVIGLAAERRRPVPLPPRPVLVSTAAPILAILRGQDRAAVVSISFDPDTGYLSVATEALRTGRRSAQLWVISADKQPRSLGLLRADQPSRFHVPRPRANQIGPGSTLAVSLEPAGGSPTDKPTGPVIMSGIVPA